MITEEQYTNLIAYIKKNYDNSDGARTSLWSEGNYDDVFSDGVDRGECITLYTIAKLIGMDVVEPDKQEYDW